MKRSIIIFLIGLLGGCMDAPQGNLTTNEEQKKAQDTVGHPGISKLEAQLKKEGYQTFSYKDGDTTYLMQQYYIVFLKAGPNRSQDSTAAAELQKKHQAHLSRLYQKGYTSLTGPMGDDGDIRGIVVFNTATQKEADSLARLDPMVEAGRLEVEVHPWWVAKGGKLN